MRSGDGVRYSKYNDNHYPRRGTVKKMYNILVFHWVFLDLHRPFEGFKDPFGQQAVTSGIS